MTKSQSQRRMSEQTWPAEGLESVPNCPICGSSSRHLLHEKLSDRVFFVAPGKWSLWQCGRCRSAWLDPRPTEATIGGAYSSYYTHEEAELAGPQTGFEHLRAALGNGYRNHRFRSRLSPALPIGALLATLVPPLRWPIDVAYRFLPKAAPDKAFRVLDIGCSNGAWLELARNAGWDVAGAEPDPVSRRVARERGIEVRESVGDWLDNPESFDWVTISHVIEHVHDPLSLLRDSFRLLRPGGGLYVDTPNIDAVGHSVYGADWLALDPPRHLILFNRKSLSDSVKRSGFEKIRFRPRTDAFSTDSELSRRIASGLDPFSSESLPTVPAASLRQRVRALLARRNAEFLTLTAAKPV